MRRALRRRDLSDLRREAVRLGNERRGERRHRFARGDDQADRVHGFRLDDREWL